MPSPTVASVRTSVHCLTTGQVRTKQGERGARRYLPGGWRDEVMPVNVFLIEHVDGLCLFDTGQTADAVAPGYFPRWYPFFKLARFELDARDEAAAQLARHGVPPETVRWVVLSHLHTDHVGGLAAFSNAEVVVSEREWARARGIRGRLRGYLPQYWPTSLTPRVVEFDAPGIGPFRSAYPLTDDGALELVPTPGHTPGHMSMIVRTEGRELFLCGDLVERAAELDQTAPAIADWCRDSGVAVLATHDPDASSLAGER